jgi:hypothetical protein
MIKIIATLTMVISIVTIIIFRLWYDAKYSNLFTVIQYREHVWDYWYIWMPCVIVVIISGAILARDRYR